MSFTVLGAAGMIGRHLVAELHKSGEEVFAPQRGDEKIFTQSLGHVIYAIGLTADFRTRTHATVEAHVSYLSRVLQNARFDSLLYLSSTRVYGAGASGREDAVLQVSPQNPSDLYNLSKLLGESLCLTCNHPAVRVARLSNVVGDDSPESENFVSALLREARTGHIVLRTALSSAKDYIHIDDVSAILLRIAKEGRERLYNVASGHQTSNAQWVARIREVTGCTCEEAPDAPVYSFVPIDTSRLRDEFGFVPRDVLANTAPVYGARA